MTEHAAGRFVEFTSVLWIDIVLNAAYVATLPGLLLWIGWGVRERRYGPRGAKERNRQPKRYMAAGRPRTRWILAWVSVAGALVQLAMGVALEIRGWEDVTFAWVMGLVFALVWACVMPLLRPRGHE